MQTLAALGIDPQKILQDYGIWVTFLVIFVESGLMVGFFLPGDSLLFTAGLLTATHILKTNFAVLMLGVFVAAVLGDQLGYYIGTRLGDTLFDRDTRFIKRTHVQRAHNFFEQRGPAAVIIARFVPIVRCFVPVLAGISDMRYRTFLRFDIVGGLLWGVGVTSLGWALGKRYPWLGDKIDVLVLVIVAVSFVPVALEFFKHRRTAAASPGK